MYKRQEDSPYMGQLQFQTGVGSISTKMIILGSGNVGIGTTSPNSMLTVWDNAGTFNARESGVNVHRPNSYGQYGSFSYDGGTTFFASTYTGNGVNDYGAYLFQQYNSTSTPQECLEIGSDGDLRFRQYSGTQQVGTPTYILGTNSSGNVVKVLGADIPGSVSGSGTLRTIPMWTPDGTTLGNSVLKQDVACLLYTSPSPRD